MTALLRPSSHLTAPAWLGKTGRSPLTSYFSPIWKEVGKQHSLGLNLWPRPPHSNILWLPCRLSRRSLCSLASCLLALQVVHPTGIFSQNITSLSLSCCRGGSAAENPDSLNNRRALRPSFGGGDAGISHLHAPLYPDKLYGPATKNLLLRRCYNTSNFCSICSGCVNKLHGATAYNNISSCVCSLFQLVFCIEESKVFLNESMEYNDIIAVSFIL